MGDGLDKVRDAPRCRVQPPPSTLVAAGEDAGDAKGAAMTRIRLTQLGSLTLLLAWFVSSPLQAFATPDPPPGYYASPGPPLPADPPAQPTVVHDHIAVWNYLLIVGLTVVGTLIVVSLVARVRRPTVHRAEQPTGA
jgi:hypothetical protein